MQGGVGWDFPKAAYNVFILQPLKLNPAYADVPAWLDQHQYREKAIASRASKVILQAVVRFLAGRDASDERAERQRENRLDVPRGSKHFSWWHLSAIFSVSVSCLGLRSHYEPVEKCLFCLAIKR